MIDKPNLVLPLASSYNERGVDGFANTVTNGIDQRKVNSYYEFVQNAASGSVTPYLTKRPGVTDSGGTFGSSSQVAHLISLKAGSVGDGSVSDTWVYSKLNDDIRASDSAGTTTVIDNTAGYAPVYVSKTAVSGTDTVIVQLRNASNAQRVFFSSAIATWTQISDSDFTGLTLRGKMEFMDGYAFALDSTNKVYNSDINSLAAWTASSYITKQIVQDEPTALARFGKTILAFGVQTCEVFRNAGNPTGSPLVSIPELSNQRVGMFPPTSTTGKHYYTMLGAKMYMIGTYGGRRQAQRVFSYDGASFDRISSSYIEKILNRSGTDFLYMSTMVFKGKFAVAIALQSTDDSTQPHRWLMFFPDSKEWFEWTSTKYIPMNNGQFYLGFAGAQDKIYSFGDTDNWQDDSTNYEWQHQFQLPVDGNHRKFMPICGLIGDTARSAQTISVAFSDDDYQNFQTARTIDMTGFQKALYRCGSYRTRAVRLSYTGANEVRLMKFVARIT